MHIRFGDHGLMVLQERNREVERTIRRSIYAWTEQDRFSGTYPLCEECSFSASEPQTAQVRLIRKYVKCPDGAGNPPSGLNTFISLRRDRGGL